MIKKPKPDCANASEIEISFHATVHGEFKAKLEELSALCKSDGLESIPYADGHLPHFSALDFEQQRDVLRRLSAYVDMVTTTKEIDGKVLNNNAAAVWRALSKAGLIPPDGLMDLITDQHIIEIYNLESRQIFRSFSFYPLTTYSLEEIHCIPWYNLWRRDDFNQQRQMDLLNDLLAGKFQQPFELDPRVHTVQEIATKTKRSAHQRQDKASPLFDRVGKLDAFMVLSYVEKVWDAN